VRTDIEAGDDEYLRFFWTVLSGRELSTTDAQYNGESNPESAWGMH
jgi:hypothetical protein